MKTGRPSLVYRSLLLLDGFFIGVWSTAAFPTSGAGIQLYLIAHRPSTVLTLLPPPSPSPTPEEGSVGRSVLTAVIVPGRGGGPSLSAGGRRFASPTGTPAQAFLSPVSVRRSRSEAGGRKTFRVRTPAAQYSKSMGYIDELKICFSNLFWESFGLRLGEDTHTDDEVVVEKECFCTTGVRRVTCGNKRSSSFFGEVYCDVDARFGAIFVACI